MMATVPLSSSSLLPLLDSLEDNAAGLPEQTDAYLTIANRLNGEGRQFLPAVVKHFSRLGKTLQTHISSQNAELSQAALQALGFCVFHAHVVSAIPANFADELLLSLCSLVMKSKDKNTCTRALWVISKQNFSSEVVAKKVPEILRTLECLQMREDIQSVVIEHESLNVIVRLLEQAPVQMGTAAVQWAKLIIPLVVHSASKVRLRAAGALEMGLPLLLERQKAVVAVVEPIMSSKLIPELQKMFATKNEANVLKLWPLFVRLLGKLLHKGGPFINSLLGLEELGFRSSSPNIKKIAFIAWKSLIDNFALHPEILCSAKRLKLLMQPLSSIHVRTEALLLTKLEVWWYLVVKLGPNLSAHFEQVGVPLLQCTLGPDSSPQGTPVRSSNQNSVNTTPKAAAPAFSVSAVAPRLSLNNSVVIGQAYPSIQLLGLEMLLHYFLGPEISSAAAKNNLTLSLEPLVQPLLSSPSSFNKHAGLLITAVHDSIICIGKDAPDSLLALIWKSLVSFVSTTIDAAGHNKERQGSEVLTLLLQNLQSIISSEVLPAHRALSLLEMTIKGIPQRVLGSASYQVGKMDVLNGTPALFLIILFYTSTHVAGFVEDERFFLCLETLVNCGLSGPTSPLAFGEAVLGAMGRAAGALGTKEQLWRMWSVVVNPLTDTITQTNEVNQGDALEHNFSAVHSALMFPITHLLPGQVLPQMTQKSMLTSWSRLYKVFARCSALVATAEENVCCEELCSKMAVSLDEKALNSPSMLDMVVHMLLVIIESADFSPYTPQSQQKMKSPHTPLTWIRKKSKALGNLSTFQTLLVRSLGAFDAFEAPDMALDSTGLALVSILSTLFSNLAQATAIQESLASLTQPLTALYEKAGRPPNGQPKYILSLGAKLDRLLGDLLGCLQTRSSLAYDDDLLSLLSPLLCVLFLHRIKHVRSLVTHFWNATFAKAMVLAYPEELRPVLSQVKQNTPILLPGFQSVGVPDELNGLYSSESSQLDTMLSGVDVTPGVKRDSLLARSGETKDRNPKSSTKPVSTKLDFGSPKPPRREVLEEQASMDFVFIPPETKERVLTEHQKEVKRTKRVDIPAMYNNLDASLDTTAFTQYTQEESLDKLPADDQASHAANVEVNPEILEVENMEVGNDACDILVTNTQEYQSPSALTNDTAEPAKERVEPVEVVPDSADVSLEVANEDVLLDQDVLMKSAEDDTSLNVSGASDVVSGTPQKPNSRRQSFITLEKYTEGKPSSPASVKFADSLSETSRSHVLEPSYQEPPYQEPSYQEPPVEKEADTDQLAAPGTEPTKPINPSNESSQKGEKPSADKSSETTEDEGDVIPDTQTQVDVLKEDPVEVLGDNRQKEEFEGHLEDSTSSGSQASLSTDEPRRSGRRRSRPLRPGEEPDERHSNEYFTSSPKGAPSPASQTNSQSQGRTRSNKLPVEVEAGQNKLRTRSQQSNSQVATGSPAGNSQSQGTRVSSRRSYKLGREELVKDIRMRKGSKTDSPSKSDTDSQSQGRHPHRTKLAVGDEGEGSQKLRARKEKPNLPDSHDSTPAPDSQSQGRASRRSKAFSDSEELDHKQDTTEVQDQTVTSIVTYSPAVQTKDGQSLGITISPSESNAHSDDKVQVEVEDQLSQISSQNITPSTAPAVSQSQVRSSRKSKVSVEVAQSEDKSQHVTTDSAAVPEACQTDSNLTPSSSSQEDSQPKRTGRLSKRSRTLEKPLEAGSCSPTPAVGGAGQSGTLGSSHGSGRTTRLRASLGLSSMVDSPQSGISETLDNMQKDKKRDRKSKSLESLPIPSATVLSGEPHADQEMVMESSQKSDSQNPSRKALEIGIPMDIEDAHVLVAAVSVLELATSENAKTSQQIHSSVEPDVEQQKKESVHNYLNGISNLKTLSSQESDLECDGLTLPNKHLLPDYGQDHPVSSMKENAILDEDSVFLEPNPCRPPIATSIPTGTQPSDVAEAEQLKTQKPEDSEEKNVEVVPTSLALSSEDVTSDQDTEMVENMENIPPEATNVLEPDQPDVVDDSGMSIQAQPECSIALNQVQEEEEVPDNVNTFIWNSQPECSNTVVENQETKINNVDQSLRPAQPECSNTVVENQETKINNFDQSLGQSQPECSIFLENKETTVIIEADKSNELIQTGFSKVLQEEQYTSIKEVLAESKVPSVGPDNTQPQDYKVLDNFPLQEGAGTNHVSDRESVEQGDDTQIDSNNLDGYHIDSVAALTASHNEPLIPSTSKDVLCQDSPPKQRGLDAALGLEVGQSPSSCRARGAWSPSASPSTSILKKGQKRQMEEESPSPFTKCRRVSFADPIQRQELADDIDRRSPVIRSNSPRTKSISGIPQPKFNTTPTKGLLILSPRNLHCPGYKSSKKCLISEMGQEPRPIPKDCVYPALVSCSTPVEAVLPQITSNMWPRGFGQLVRARNIKTVGDLSALTPGEIKNLPIRSPKISNVKKALKSYHEQQRKGRSDELKSFDEMEKMTSELEEPTLPQKPEEEEDKTSVEALATELLDEPISMGPCPEDGTHQNTPNDHRPEGDLVSELETLGNRMTGEELTLLSPDQLLQLHDHLAGMMRTVVVQLQSRILGQNQDTEP